MLRNSNKIIGVDLSYDDRIREIASMMEDESIYENIIPHGLSSDNFNCLCRSLRYFEKKNNKKLTSDDLCELMDYFDLNKFL